MRKASTRMTKKTRKKMVGFWSEDCLTLLVQLLGVSRAHVLETYLSSVKKKPKEMEKRV